MLVEYGEQLVHLLVRVLWSYNKNVAWLPVDIVTAQTN